MIKTKKLFEKKFKILAIISIILFTCVIAISIYFFSNLDTNIIEQLKINISEVVAQDFNSSTSFYRDIMFIISFTVALIGFLASFLLLAFGVLLDYISVCESEYKKSKILKISGALLLVVSSFVYIFMYL